MTVKQRVVLSQIEVQPNGTVQVRLDKQMFMPATKRKEELVIQHEYHRTVIEPGISADDQIAYVNAGLKAMGWPSVDPATTARIKRIVGVEHTPDVIERHKEHLRAQGVRFGDEEDATDAEKGIPTPVTA